MAYLGTIVRHLEDTFHVKVHGQFHTRTEIEGTRFLTQKRIQTRTMGTSCFISHVPRQPPLPGALRPPSLPVSYRPRRHPAISRTSC